MQGVENLLSYLTDDNIAFIVFERFGIQKDEETYDAIYRGLAEAFNKHSEKELFRLKFCAILGDMGKIEKKNYYESMDTIHKYNPRVRIDHVEYSRQRLLNKDLSTCWGTNKKLYELLKYLLTNTGYKYNTVLQFWDWMVKYKILDGIDVDAVLKKINPDYTFRELIDSSTTKLICRDCHKEIPTTKMLPGKTRCVDCAARAESLGKLGLKSHVSISQIEKKINTFKSDTVQTQDEVQHSLAFLNYQSMFHTLMSNIDELSEIDVNSLSTDEKQSVLDYNNRIINKLKEMESSL